MNIALIHTETDYWALGSRIISAVLKREGHDSRLILMGSPERQYSPDTLSALKGLISDADIVGVSSFSRGSEKAKQVINAAKSIGKITIWGGVHATLFPEECGKEADLVCIGEGEYFILDVIESLQNGNNWKSVKNGAYFKDGRFIINEFRPLISNLDELPIPDYTRSDEYHLDSNGFNRIVTQPNKSEPIMFTGSRGCAFHCNYCSNAKLKQIFSGTGRYVRKMSIQKYVEQASALKEVWPQASYFYLVDEDFMARSVEELREFSKEFPAKVGLPFECMASPPMVTEEKMDLLVKAGLWRIDLGVESGSERTKREVFNRPINNQKVLRAAKIINKHRQVVPYYFFIIGNPYENRDDLLETIDLINQLPTPYFLRAYNLVFFPGSFLYEMALQDGIITSKDDSGYEMDFLAGLDYRRHSWKQKELYLNGLIFLMSGKSNKWRAGVFPRFLLRFLTNSRIVEFNSRRPVFIKAMVLSHMAIIKIRRFLLVWLRSLVKDPRRIYRVGARERSCEVA
ncbi:MAG: B12-binding domain-containing radical SAM protein [Deltaproteobacteria bacterium]|nr:B12-binding domain-containing radical SAM protein [Deltaproteobacteria bacterium]MBW2024930.1 B12-binding domain-containing radical SAM protein [Deltaproteobacteria bacterium]MBW2124959.1 B12-binding domain-containing radical SAM protein [Deltaproteobacteria bacterium]